MALTCDLWSSDTLGGGLRRCHVRCPRPTISCTRSVATKLDLNAQARA
jgi:hypothetical protein